MFGSGRDRDDMAEDVRNLAGHRTAAENDGFEPLGTGYETEGLDSAHSLKVVVVGSCFVGKTTFLRVGTGGQFLQEYVSHGWDNPQGLFRYRGEIYRVTFWDTAGQEDYDRLRSLCYPETDLFLLCFAVDDSQSLNELLTKFVDEIRLQVSREGEPLFALVGMKSDLRNDEARLEELEFSGRSMVTTVRAQRACIDIGALTYIECSSKTPENVLEVMRLAVPFGVLRNRFGNERRSGLRGLLTKKSSARKSALSRVISTIHESESYQQLRQETEVLEERAREEKRLMLNSMKAEVLEWHVLFGQLFSADLIREIIGEFHCVDVVRDVLRSRIGFDGIDRETLDSLSSLRREWYGYFPHARDDVFQVFYSFRVYRDLYDYSNVKWLPRWKKYVEIPTTPQGSLPRVGYGGYFEKTREKPFVLFMRNFGATMGSRELQDVLADCDLSQLTEGRFDGSPYFEEGFADFVSENMSSLEIAAFWTNWDVPFDLNLPNLRVLRLKDFGLSSGLTFRGLPSLESIKISVQREQLLMSRQLENLSALPHIQSVRLQSVDLSQCSQDLHLLICDHKNIRRILIEACRIHLPSLRTCILRDRRQLTYCVVFACNSGEFPEEMVSSFSDVSKSDPELFMWALVCGGQAFGEGEASEKFSLTMDTSSYPNIHWNAEERRTSRKELRDLLRSGNSLLKQDGE